MRTFKLFGMFIVMSLLAIASCQGPPGVQGPPGHDGNANVQSATIETSPYDWGWDDNAANWYLDLEWDAIDLDMVDFGAVLVYMENPGEFYGWHQLPLTLYPDNQYSSSIETVYYDYGLTLFWTNSDLQQHQNPCDLYNANLTFKVVLIDATTFSNYINEDLSDYETVKRIFNISE